MDQPKDFANLATRTQRFMAIEETDWRRKESKRKEAFGGRQEDHGPHDNKQEKFMPFLAPRVVVLA